MIAKLTNIEMGLHWDVVIEVVEFSLNNTKQKSVAQYLSKLLFGIKQKGKFEELDHVSEIRDLKEIRRKERKRKKRKEETQLKGQRDKKIYKNNNLFCKHTSKRTVVFFLRSEFYFVFVKPGFLINLLLLSYIVNIII